MKINANRLVRLCVIVGVVSMCASSASTAHAQTEYQQSQQQWMPQSRQAQLQLYLQQLMIYRASLIQQLHMVSRYSYEHSYQTARNEILYDRYSAVNGIMSIGYTGQAAALRLRIAQVEQVIYAVHAALEQSAYSGN